MTRRQILYKLNEWLQNFPAKEKVSCPFETDNWPTISYHNSVTVLLRPVVLEVSKLGVDSSPDCVRWFNLFFESASTICLSYKKMYLKRMFRYTWLTVHCYFVAGIPFLYCVWLDRNFHILRPHGKNLIYETISSCSSILYVAAERWHCGSIFRDTFEHMSEIVKQSMDNDAEDMTGETSMEKDKESSVTPETEKSVDMQAEAIKFYSLPEISGKQSMTIDNLDELWEFFDITGDKFLRSICSEIGDGGFS